MYKNKVMIAAPVFFAFLGYSCSHCSLLSNNSFESLKKARNVQLEIWTKDGQAYLTRNFEVEHDSLIIKDALTHLGEKDKIIKVPLSSIASIKYCEFGSRQAYLNGVKVLAVVMILVAIHHWAPFHVGTIGG